MKKLNCKQKKRKERNLWNMDVISVRKITTFREIRKREKKIFLKEFLTLEQVQNKEKSKFICKLFRNPVAAYMMCYVAMWRQHMAIDLIHQKEEVSSHKSSFEEDFTALYVRFSIYCFHVSLFVNLNSFHFMIMIVNIKK